MVPQRLMWPLVVVEPEGVLKSAFQLMHRPVFLDGDVFVLHRAPAPLHEDVIERLPRPSILMATPASSKVLVKAHDV